MSAETLQIAVKRRDVKSKGEKERYTHLNAESNARVQPQQDPREPSGWIASENERERKKKRRERKRPDQSVQQSLAVALFFTIAFIP